MHRIAWILSICLATTALAAPKLSRGKAVQRISEFAFARLDRDAIEIRGITQQNGSALVEATIALAFQFKKETNGEWTVDAIRLGDRDWMDAAELAAAAGIALLPGSAGNRPASTTDPLHSRPTNAERTRERLNELGSSARISKAIRLRRIISMNEHRTLAEATVSLAFRFKQAANSDWIIEAGRVGPGDWIDSARLAATIQEGRRRETLNSMKLLAAGIERYILEDGSLPPGKDVAEITNVLHPLYMSSLVREDAWGRPIEYTASGFTFRLLSFGADGLRGTPDDIVVP